MVKAPEPMAEALFKFRTPPLRTVGPLRAFVPARVVVPAVANEAEPLRIPPEISVNVAPDATLIGVPMSEPVAPRFKVAPEAKAIGVAVNEPLRSSVPALIVVVPLKELAVLIVTVFVPFMIKPPVPTMPVPFALVRV